MVLVSYCCGRLVQKPPALWFGYFVACLASSIAFDHPIRRSLIN
jgi:hypothetical protein